MNGETEFTTTESEAVALHPPCSALSLSQLIQHVGDDNVVVQNIMHSTPTVRRMKHDASVVFYTDTDKGSDLMNQMMGHSGKWTGLIVWLPTERLPDVKKQNK